MSVANVTMFEFENEDSINKFASWYKGHGSYPDNEVSLFVKTGVDYDDSYESDATRLAIRNYIENKHEEDAQPTVKQIQSRMKGTTLTSQEIIDIVEELGFEVEYNKEAISRSRIVIGENISITD